MAESSKLEDPDKMGEGKQECIDGKLGTLHWSGAWIMTSHDIHAPRHGVLLGHRKGRISPPRSRPYRTGKNTDWNSSGVKIMLRNRERRL